MSWKAIALVTIFCWSVMSYVGARAYVDAFKANSLAQSLRNEFEAYKRTRGVVDTAYVCKAKR